MRPEDLLPGYIRLHETGELKERIDRASGLLRCCTVCPRKCGVDRQKDERGFCRTGILPVIAGFGPHFGEVPPTKKGACAAASITGFTNRKLPRRTPRGGQNQFC